MSTPEQIEKAIGTAEQIAKAVVKKFPKYEFYVRRYEAADSGFIQVVIKPENSGRTQELATAYSDEFFINANAQNISEKARRILHDFRILAGVRV